jgi:hypothetical protein
VVEELFANKSVCLFVWKGEILRGGWVGELCLGCEQGCAVTVLGAEIAVC